MEFFKKHKFFTAALIVFQTIVLTINAEIFFKKPVVNTDGYSPDVSYIREEPAMLTFEDGNLYYTYEKLAFPFYYRVKEKLNSRSIPIINLSIPKSPCSYELGHYEYDTREREYYSDKYGWSKDDINANKNFAYRKNTETSEVEIVQEVADSICGYGNTIFAVNNIDRYYSELTAYDAYSLEEKWKRNIVEFNSEFTRMYAFSDNILVFVAKDWYAGRIYVYNISEDTMKDMLYLDKQAKGEVCFTDEYIYYSCSQFTPEPLSKKKDFVFKIWRYNVETEEDELVADLEKYKPGEIIALYSFDDRYIWIVISLNYFNNNGNVDSLLRLDTQTLEVEVIR